MKALIDIGIDLADKSRVKNVLVQLGYSSQLLLRHFLEVLIYYFLVRLSLCIRAMFKNFLQRGKIPL